MWLDSWCSSSLQNYIVTLIFDVFNERNAVDFYLAGPVLLVDLPLNVLSPGLVWVMKLAFSCSALFSLSIIFKISGFVEGTLDSETVKHWSAQVEKYLLRLAEEGLKTRELQKLYDSANYTVEEKSGFDTINSVKSRLGNYFVKKETTARVWIFFLPFKKLNGKVGFSVYLPTAI